MATQTSSKTPKIAVAVVLIAVCGYYAYAQYSKFSTPLRPEPPAPVEVVNADGTTTVVEAPAQRRGPGGPGGPGGSPPSEAEREAFRNAMRQEMITELQLTPEQQTKMEEVMNSEGGPREHMRAMREVLTPEQQEKARNMREQHMTQMMNRRLEEAKKTLPESEVKKLEEKMKERLEARRNGERPSWAPEGGRGDRGGEGPPPPPPGD